MTMTVIKSTKSRKSVVTCLVAVLVTVLYFLSADLTILSCLRRGYKSNIPEI